MRVCWLHAFSFPCLLKGNVSELKLIIFSILLTAVAMAGIIVAINQGVFEPIFFGLLAYVAVCFGIYGLVRLTKNLPKNPKAIPPPVPVPVEKKLDEFQPTLADRVMEAFGIIRAILTFAFGLLAAFCFYSGAAWFIYGLGESESMLYDWGKSMAYLIGALLSGATAYCLNPDKSYSNFKDRD